MASKKEEKREISKFLKEVKKKFPETSKEVIELFRDDSEVAKGIENLKDQEIPIFILYQLYWYANKKWISATNAVSASAMNKVEAVMIWRSLRDVLNTEIERRF